MPDVILPFCIYSSLFFCVFWKIILLGRYSQLSVKLHKFSFVNRLYLRPIWTRTISDYQTLIILQAYALVVELFSIRDLAADCPLKKSRGFNLALIQLIFSTFVTFTPMYISSLRCGLIVFRIFQQLNAYFSTQLTLCRPYYI